MVNWLRTGVLLAALTALFMGVGYLIGGTGGMLVAFGIALVTNLVGYWNADKMVLAMQNAQEVDPRQAPDLYGIVERLARNAGIPTPRVYIINTEQPNAFATGRDPEHAAVAVSAGLLRTLDQRELAGVIAHELTHIRNRDTLTMTITGTFAGAISMLAQFGLFFGGGFNNRNNPLGPIGAIVMVIVAPIAAALVQMAVSRTREYEADRGGAEISGDPLALASALRKIARVAPRVPNLAAERTPAQAHMYIFNPLGMQPGDNLFATHPDVGNRIAALERMAVEMGATHPPMSAGRSFAPTPEPASTGPWSRNPRTDREDGFGGPWG